jgi:predicted nucleotidyltransferase
MRLSPDQRQAIRDAAKLCFGEDAQVWLFGSRVDDEKRGGDIDLFIRPPQTCSYSEIEIFKRKIRFLGCLEKELGERKIDVVIASRNASRPIEQIAQGTGVRV